MTPHKKLRTPIIKPRTQGGTFYTFSSALEDIGLNINEAHNKVSISHYALLDIPSFNTKFNTLSDSSFSADVNVGDYRFAEGFENYVLNMETVLCNQPTYNFADSRTVSERVFWKWMQKSCMSMQPDASDNNYYIDANQTVKGFGLITSGAQRSDSYGLYNETFVQIPSSYGQMKVLFKRVNDNNCYTRSEKYYASDASGYIENIGADEISAEGKLHTGISAKAIYDTNASGTVPGSYTVGHKDVLCIEFDLDNLRKYYDNQTLTYDDLAIDEGYNFYGTSSYKFNAVLIYYSIYDSANKNIISTNAYGILLLNSAQPDSITSNDYIFPELVKTKATSTTSGTSYAFRLNVKTTSVYSGDVLVHDDSTTSYSMASDFNDVVHNLSAAIDVMKSNTNYLRRIANDNEAIKEFAANATDRLDDMEHDITLLKSGVFNRIDSSYLHVDVLDADTVISDVTFSDGVTEFGSIHGDTLEYEKGHFNHLDVDSSASIPELYSESTIVKSSGTHTIKDENGNQYSKVSGSGIFSSNDLYFGNPNIINTGSISRSTAKEIMTKTQFFFDASSKAYNITFPAESDLGEEARQILKTLSTQDQEREYIDANNLLILCSVILTGGDGTDTEVEFYFDNIKSKELKHDLKKTRPNVMCVDSEKNIVYANIQYISDNTVLVSFNERFTGHVYIN